MKIKICGLTRCEETDYLNEAKVDYAGFVFYEKSKRNVDLKQAEEIMKQLDTGIKRVAVTVSPDSNLIERIQNSGFDIIQVHKELGESELDIINIPVWYAVNISNDDELEDKIRMLDSFNEINRNKIKGIVVDAPDFGSGRPFNWKKSKRLMKAGAQSPPDIISSRDFILAGGLNAANVAEGIKIFNPDVVDVSSSVEGNNGKDRDRIIEFVNAVRNV